MAQAGLAIENERLHARVQALEARVQALEAAPAKACRPLEREQDKTGPLRIAVMNAYVPGPFS